MAWKKSSIKEKAPCCLTSFIQTGCISQGGLARVGLLARGEGFPEEILARLFVPAWGLLERWAFLPLRHLAGIPSEEGAGAGLGGPTMPPGKESQEAIPLPFCSFLCVSREGRTRGVKQAWTHSALDARPPSLLPESKLLLNKHISLS